MSKAETRHCKYAGDTCRICIALPSSLVEYAKALDSNISRSIRRVLLEHFLKAKARKERNEKSL